MIEWPEEVLIDEFDRSGDTVAVMHAAGASVAIDRFGDGRASLGYLQRFDVDVVKLGRQLANRLVGLSGNPALVHGVVDLAHALGTRVVADGIERPEQLAALEQTACDMAQGFLFARPMRVAELHAVAEEVSARKPRTAPRLTGNRF